MRDLRLLGCFDDIQFESFGRFAQLGWSGVVINAISGACLFTSQATTFVDSTPFLLKISMIFLAVICAAIIQNRVHADASTWDRAGSAAPSSVRLLAVTSIVLWTGAIISGRLVAYL